MAEIVKQEITSYTMKMQIYPSKEQVNKFEKAFRALEIAYNMTFHEVFQKNPAVCGEPDKKGKVWPDFGKMAKASWRAQLIQKNPAVEIVPAASLENQNGLFLNDAKKAWETGMRKRPISEDIRKDFRFYNAGEPRRSFVMQIKVENILLSEDNPKVAWIKLGKKFGKVKARGFNRKIWFGENGTISFAEAVEAGEIAKELTIKIVKDTCGAFFICVTISKGKTGYKIWRERKDCAEKAPIGLDAGVKSIAVLNDGTDYENKRFKKQKDKILRKLNRQLSRQWGFANMAYRDYRESILEGNKEASEVPKKPLPKPSNRYQETKRRKARLERKIARQRDTYYHQITAEIIQRANLIAIETLRVKNMMKNHKLAYSLSDAAMSDFLSKLKYKATWEGVPLLTIGTFEPSSQICSQCGNQNKELTLADRKWTCKECGAENDRDVNAAKNILRIAQESGSVEDKEIQEKGQKKTKKGKRRKKDQLVFKDNPDIVIQFSEEYTRDNDPRYVIVDKKEKKVIDDANRFGYRSVSNARNCYKAKVKWPSRQI